MLKKMSYWGGILICLCFFVYTVDAQTITNEKPDTFRAISVISPNGGEEWYVGVTNTITWTPYSYSPNPVNIASDVDVFLERKIGSSFRTVGKVLENGKASMHTHFEVGTRGNYAKAGEYYVRVVNRKTGKWDRSDSPFRLINDKTTVSNLSISRPSGGEQYRLGDIIPLSISYNGLGTASVALYENEKWVEWFYKDVPIFEVGTKYPLVLTSEMMKRVTSGKNMKIYITAQANARTNNNVGYVDAKSASFEIQKNVQDTKLGLKITPEQVQSGTAPRITWNNTIPDVTHYILSADCKDSVYTSGVRKINLCREGFQVSANGKDVLLVSDVTFHTTGVAGGEISLQLSAYKGDAITATANQVVKILPQQSVQPRCDLAQLVELLIALKVIPAEKATQARTAVNAMCANQRLLSTSQTSVSSCGVFDRDLTIGSSGGDVVGLQTFLQNLGYLSVSSDTQLGYFGPLTRTALMQYQINKSIVPANGYFGPKTRETMGECA